MHSQQGLSSSSSHHSISIPHIVAPSLLDLRRTAGAVIRHGVCVIFSDMNFLRSLAGIPYTT